MLQNKIISIFILFTIVTFLGCDLIKKENEQKPRTPNQANQAKPVPVTIAAATQKPVPIQLKNIGTIEASCIVSIKSQVAAELVSIHFQEGQNVNAGDVLFTLDRRSFEANLKKIQANLEKNLVQLKNAKKEATRSEELWKKGIISVETRDNAQAAAEAMEASVHADMAAVEASKLELSYCTILSPISGRTGQYLVHSGNLLKANDATLVVIHQTKPIEVLFSVPEKELPTIKRYLSKKKLEVKAFLPESEENPEIGTLSFINNTVDKATGTILLKGNFENKNERLWPGQFVNVVLTLDIEPNAITIPSQAIQTGQQGTYTFVVTPDLTVESRLVKVSREIGEESVIAEGIQASEKVVTDGHLRLTNGSKIEIKNSSVSEVKIASHNLTNIDSNIRLIKQTEELPKESIRKSKQNNKESKSLIIKTGTNGSK